LKRFLDDATEGFIYVSLGTTVTCSNLPKEIANNFAKVFPKLPYKIVWKFECAELLGQFDNAFISKWFPQQGVLGKIKSVKFIIPPFGISNRSSIYATRCAN